MWLPGRRRRRSAFSLIELLAAIAVMGTLAALLIPAVQASREASRRGSCLNNLRQLGVSIHSFESEHRHLPNAAETRRVPSTIPIGLDGVFRNAFVVLLPHLEERQLADLYDDSVPWYWQDAELTSATIPTLTCPSNFNTDNPYFDQIAEVLTQVFGSPAGGSYGLTTYVFSKGPNDAYCNDARRIPAIERGMFDYNAVVKSSAVSDGLSKTLCVGEAANGAHWQLCRDPGGTKPDLAQPAEVEAYYARQYWIGSGGNKSMYDAPAHWAATGILAATVDPINKNPVTMFLFDDEQQGTQCQGTLTFPGNTHRSPSFRSDHPGGANFQWGDGSVSFVSDSIHIKVLRALSTIAGAEAADY